MQTLNVDDDDDNDDVCSVVHACLRETAATGEVNVDDITIDVPVVDVVENEEKKTKYLQVI